jgi:nicotinamide-nucleotide amidase
VRVETICTGDELLTGLTSDTNSRYFQEQLLLVAGLTVRRSVVVGDVPDDIVAALDDAAGRCDAVLVSGGLGPTTDDITAACAARAAGVPLVESPEVLAHLVARARARGLTVTPNNLRQALVPEGAEVVANAEGSAPLLIQRRGGCTFFFVPGVPREYRHLVSTHVVPWLAARRGDATVRVLRVLKVVGLAESHLDARITPIAPRHPRLTFGYRTHPPENHLKLLAEAPTRAEAEAALAEADADARQVLGTHCFGADQETLAGVALGLLRQRQERLALAESCTGGLVGALLTEVPGASEVLFGGVVTYLDAAKLLWAQVPQLLVAREGAVSRACALAMAHGVRESTGVSWSLSVTGFAGPEGGTPEEPVGAVYVAVVGPGVEQVERHFFPGDRDRVRRFAAHAAVDLLRRACQASPP